MQFTLQFWRKYQDEYDLKKVGSILYIINSAIIIICFFLAAANYYVFWCMKHLWEELGFGNIFLFIVPGVHITIFFLFSTPFINGPRRNKWIVFTYFIALFLLFELINGITIWTTLNTLWETMYNETNIWRTSSDLITVSICLLTSLQQSRIHLWFTYWAYKDDIKSVKIEYGPLNIADYLFYAFLLLSFNPLFWGFIIYPLFASLTGKVRSHRVSNQPDILDKIETRFGFHVQRKDIYGMIIGIVEFCVYIFNKHDFNSVVDTIKMNTMDNYMWLLLWVLCLMVMARSEMFCCRSDACIDQVEGNDIHGDVDADAKVAVKPEFYEND